MSVYDMSKYCSGIIILNLNKSDSASFIFNDDHLTIMMLYEWVLLTNIMIDTVLSFDILHS